MDRIRQLRISIIIAIAMIFYSGILLAEEDAAVLSIMIGTIECSPRGSEVWVAATEGMKLYGGDKVRTGSDGMLSILFSNGSMVSLKANSEFEIESLNISKKGDEIEDVAYKLNLTRGKLRAMVEELGEDSTFEIKTPTAVAAIRGTTFYLVVRELTEEELPPGVKERLMTELFVEDGGVIYINTLSGKYYSVSAGEISNSYEDGGMSEPLEVPEDKKQEWIEGWDEILAAEPYQTGGEGGPDLAGAEGAEGGGDDRQSNQLKQVLEEIYKQDEADIVWQEMAAKLVEREFLRNEIRGILEANRERRVVGYMEKISDAQTGKVLTDVQGRRVRLEQYVLRPGPNVVELLNVNLRGGTVGGDLTTMEWITTFNNSLDALGTGRLKTLPWNSYLDTQYNGSGSPVFINSPYQADGIYPTAMEVKLSHAGDSFAESRRFLNRTHSYGGIIYISGIQFINEPQLLVSNFNDSQPMAYQTAVEGNQPKGTYSTAPLLSNEFTAENTNTNGLFPGDPKGFQYKFANATGEQGAIDAAFYVISDSGIKQDGYSSINFNNIWDALRVNMRGGGKDIGNNNLEMSLSSAAVFPAGAIDLIYVPFNDMLWKSDDHIPDYSLPTATLP